MAATAAPKASAPAASRRNSVINLRLPEQDKHLIDAAAAATGKTRTEFVIDSAKQHAVDVLLDRRFLDLTETDWQALTRALDDPPPPNAALRRLMARKAPWEG